MLVIVKSTNSSASGSAQTFSIIFIQSTWFNTFAWGLNSLNISYIQPVTIGVWQAEELLTLIDELTSFRV